MEPGDLIRWRDQVWLVRKVDRDLATAVVEADRHMEVLASDADITGECTVWCKPAEDWPSATLPFRAGASRLIRIQRAASWLIRFQDWVKLDDFQIGGALYLNPTLRLGFGDRLTAIFQSPQGNLMTVAIDIPRNFKPLSEKRSLVSTAPSLPDPPAPIPAAKQVPGLFARLKRNE